MEFNKDDLEHQPASLVVTSTVSPKKGMIRFVSGDTAREIKKSVSTVVERTWFPPTTTVPQYLIKNFGEKTGVVPPISVDQFFIIETTVPTPTTTPKSKVLLDDHKLEHLKERKQNFLGLEADSLDFDFTTISPSHVKKIHISTQEPPLSRERRKKKKVRTTTPFPQDASESFEDDKTKEIDNVEFPISSRIGSSRARPKALSAQPTREELKDHKKLIDLFNAHADDDKPADDHEKTSNTPKTELLESFDVPEINKPDIEVSLTTKDPFPTFSPIPILPIEPASVPKTEKPYKIENHKFTKIAPLDNINGDMATEDPPESTPEPAPFEQHITGLWYPMKKGDIPHLGIFGGDFRRAPRKKIKTADDLRLYNEYTRENRQNRPVRIEMDNARESVRNECQENKHCGSLTKCCTKKWCDRTNNCGTGKFCLASCESTKLTFLPSSNHSEGIIDIMYD